MDKLTLEIAQEHARLGAAYFKELSKTLDQATALEMAAKYVTTLVCIHLNTPPKEPWET